MKSQLVVVLRVCIALFVSTRSSSLQKRIAGKWEAGQASAEFTAAFGRDGKASLTILGQLIG